MMSKFGSINRVASATAMAVVLGALVFTGPARAASSDPNPAQAAPAQEQVAPAPTPTERPRARRAATDRVERWITTLHDELRITPAQEPQWNAVAQVMRENAQSVHHWIEERHSNQKATNAVADLRSYEQITETHADNIKRLLPPFQALYASMTDQQKKNADVVFSRFEHPRSQKRKPA
jgi:protein CpxP